MFNKFLLVIRGSSRKIWGKALRHKIISSIIAVAVLYGGYYFYGVLTSTSGETRYVLAATEKGTLITSVSGSGQVSALNQVDLKAKVSGDVVRVNVEDGQEIKAGTLIAQLDDSDAQKSVRDAGVNLEAANLTLQKLEMPADKLSLLQAQNALTQANESRDKAQTALKKAYQDAFTTIANVVLGMSNLMSFFSSISPNQINPDFTYTSVSNQYVQNINDYQAASRDSDAATLDSLLDETYNTIQAINNGIKYENNSTYNTTTSTYLSNLSAAMSTIQSAKSSAADADRTVLEKTESLTKLQAGALPIDIQSQELTVKQRQNALLDAKAKLAGYYITAPFDGFIASLNVHKGDSIASIQSYGSIATLITKERIAGVSLNEVDAAKVEVGQKATLTFDAFPDLTITGQVAQIDAIGTVTQGVVTYNVKIAFDTQDNRVKPGMSVSAAIITDVHNDIIEVPNSSLKSQSGSYYVQIMDGVENVAANLSSQGVASKTSPRIQPVEIGLANDSMTEITGGLNGGELIVVRTIAPGAAATGTSSTARANIGGIGGMIR